MNGETKDNIFVVDHLVLVSLCVLVIVGEHHSTLEKPSAQNHRGWCKKGKTADWNTSSKKRVHMLQNQM